MTSTAVVLPSESKNNSSIVRTSQFYQTVEILHCRRQHLYKTVKRIQQTGTSHTTHVISGLIINMVSGLIGNRGNGLLTKIFSGQATMTMKTIMRKQTHLQTTERQYGVQQVSPQEGRLSGPVIIIAMRSECLLMFQI